MGSPPGSYLTNVYAIKVDWTMLLLITSTSAADIGHVITVQRLALCMDSNKSLYQPLKTGEFGEVISNGERSGAPETAFPSEGGNPLGTCDETGKPSLPLLAKPANQTNSKNPPLVTEDISILTLNCCKHGNLAVQSMDTVINIDEEEDRAKNGALRYSARNRHLCLVVATKTNSLGPTDQKVFNPLQKLASYPYAAELV
nr:unnamed protein product [Spirometra erinaceieuropaei]